MSEITIDKIYNIKLKEDELLKLRHYIIENVGSNNCDDEDVNVFVKQLADDMNSYFLHGD
jgi:hypothetical protein